MTNKKGDKRRQKGDNADTLTNKKGDNARRQRETEGRRGGHNDQEEKQEGRQRETEGRQGGHQLTNKKGDKKGDIESNSSLFGE